MSNNQNQINKNENEEDESMISAAKLSMLEAF